MALIQELLEIKKLIDRGEEILAKARLLEFIDLNPKNADAWWLASLITSAEDDRKTVIERVLKLEPNHYEARRALEKLTPKKIPAPPKVQPAKPQPIAQVGQGEPPQIMSGAVLAYMNKGYSVVNVTPNRSVLEKKGGLNWWLVITLAAISGGILSPLFFANFFLRRKRRIIIDVMSNNRVTVSGSVQNQVLDVKAVSRGIVPTPSINLVMALVYGTILTVLVCGALVGALLAINLPEDELEVGDSAYVVGGQNDRCIDTYVVPATSSGRRSALLISTEVEIIEVDETFDGTWFRIEQNGIPQGWIQSDHLSSEPPTLTLGSGTCQ